MRIALYEHAQDAHPATDDVTWSALVSLLTTHRRSTCSEQPCPGKCAGKNGRAWSPVEIEGRRLNANVRAVTSAVFDIDHVPEQVADEVIARVQRAGYGFVVHSTHSHNLAQVDGCCLRLVLPLSRPALPAEWPTVRMAAIRQLEIPADPGVKDLSRIYYLPDAPEGTEPIAGSGDGRALDVDALLEAGRAGTISPATAPAAIEVPTVEGATDLDALRRALRKVTKPESRELVRRVLAGEAIAPLGQQDTTLQRLTGLLSFVLPPETPEDAVIEILRPSLKATDWKDGFEHLVEQTRIKYRRNLERRIARDAERKQANEALWARLGAKAPATAPTPVEEGDPDPDAWLGQLVSVKVKDGEKLANNHANLCAVLQHAPAWRGVIRFNEVTKQVEYEGGPLRAGVHLDVLEGEVASWLQRSEFGTLGLNPSPSQTAEGLKQVSHANSYDPLREQLEALRWDGTPRIDTFLEVYFGAANEPEYLRLISPKWLISAVARALRPGAKVDTMLIIEGDPGMKKSTALQVLGRGYFCDTPISFNDKDSLSLISRNWIFELSELQGFKTAKDVEQLKGFLSRQEDSYRPPYGRTVVKTPRRSVFVGTTNEVEFLRHDSTGYRRFWPIKAMKIDFAALVRDRDQLWAEAVARFHQEERWWLEGDEAKLAEAQAKAKSEASGGPDEVILEWLLRQPADKRTRLTTDDVAMGALNVERAAQVNRAMRMEIGAALRRLGFDRKQKSVAGVQVWAYIAPENISSAPQVAPGQKPHPLSAVAKPA